MIFNRRHIEVIGLKSACWLCFCVTTMTHLLSNFSDWIHIELAAYVKKWTHTYFSTSKTYSYTTSQCNLPHTITHNPTLVYTLRYPISFLTNFSVFLHFAISHLSIDIFSHWHALWSIVRGVVVGAKTRAVEGDCDGSWKPMKERTERRKDRKINRKNDRQKERQTQVSYSMFSSQAHLAWK